MIDEEDLCFLRYRLAGTQNGTPFICQIGMEIDGRDGEYDHISGVNMDFANGGTNWDDLLEALGQVPDLEKDMKERSAKYFADAD